MADKTEDLSRYYRIIKAPIITEKIMTPKGPLERDKKGRISGGPRSQYGFWVHPGANKVEIRQAIEKIFKVKVEKVRTQILKGRYHRAKSHYVQETKKKKAIVTLKEGQGIDLF